MVVLELSQVVWDFVGEQQHLFTDRRTMGTRSSACPGSARANVISLPVAVGNARLGFWFFFLASIAKVWMSLDAPAETESLLCVHVATDAL